MDRHAQAERHALADLFDHLGPDAATLCAGWATADLAAHLVLRERRPDAAGGILFPLLAGRTARIQESIRDGRPWPELVAAVRSGPPPALRLADEAINTIEYFVHHEDVRRAQPDWAPRLLAPGLDQALWRRLRIMGPLLFRRAGVGVELSAPGVGTARVRPGSRSVRVSGDAGELVLFGFGRADHARVELAGDDDAVDRLRRAPLGL